MPDNDGSPRKILVYSWKPLWIYWPVYLALARTETSLPVVFQPESPSGNITDETIRHAFAEAHCNGPAVALCEPGPIPGLDEDKLFRVPVIWRMPHWLITTRPHGQIETLRCYPEKTTSGDYTRILQGAGLIPLPEKMDTSEAQDAAFLTTGGSKTNGLFTFTPIHLWNPGLHSELFPGPDRDITALLIPRAGEYPLGEHLRDAIRGHIQRVLQALGTTHGHDERMEDFVCRHQAEVDKFYGKDQNPVPPKELGRALAEYIRQGCYFPYSVVRSALIGELSSIAEDAFTFAKKAAQDRTKEQLAKLLGSVPDWSMLSFPQRQFVRTSATDRAGNGLHVRIAHASNAQLQPLVTGTTVQLSDSDLPIRVGSLNVTSRRLLCAANGDRRCLHKIKVGKSCATDENPCFGCTVAGLVMPVLRSAARDIATVLGREVTYGTCVIENDPQTALCWEDVSEVVKLFTEELRQGPGKCHVTLCPTESRTQISFSILWTGSTDSGSGLKRATKTISSWAQSHVQAGRKVTTAGFFRGGRIYQSVYPAEGEEEHTFCRCHDDYSFGYFATLEGAL